MKNILVPISLLFLFLNVRGQGLPPCPPINTLTANPDTVICNGGCASLWANGNTTLTNTDTYSLYSIPYAPMPFVGTTTYTLGDDSYTGTVTQLPFPFCFFGQVYNAFVIGSNGQISFNTGNAGGGCPWPLSTGLPADNSVATLNCIMGAYYDLWPPGGGTISTAVYGTAPCRQFVISWSNVPLYNAGTCPGLTGTQQIVLYETTNVIDINIENKPLCTNWNGGKGIVGIEDNNGTLINTNFFVAPNRNGIPFGTTNESWRFIPTGSPVITYTWTDLNTNTVVGIGQVVTVCPTAATTYQVKYTVDVGCTIVDLYETVDVTLGIADSIDYLTIVNPSICGAPDGQVILHSMTPGDTFIVNYQLNGNPQPPLTAITKSDSTITISGLGAGTYDNFYLTNTKGCESNRMGPVTLVDPPFFTDFDYSIDWGCQGDTVNFVSTSLGVIHYAWDFGDGSNSTDANPAHIYAQGTYTATLIGTNGFCIDTMSKPVTLIHPLEADFTVSKDSICNGETVMFNNNSVGTPGYTYVWDFGDGSADTAFHTSHQYTSDGIFPATLTIKDFVPCTSVEVHNIVVASIAVNVGPKDTSVCLVEPMMLYSETINPPYFSGGITYEWSPATLLENPDQPNTNFFTEDTGTYQYVLTATGYPMQCVAKDTLSIYIQPKPILLNVSPDQVIKYGTNVQLKAEGVRYYVWTPPATLDNPNISTPVATPVDSSTIYTVYGMNEHGGCRDTAMVKIDMEYTNQYVPTVFSPNGDGLNDVFRLMNMQYQRVTEFKVFDRWGREVFSTVDPKGGWDGTFNGEPQEMGVYHYLIRVALPSGRYQTYKGDITLMR